MPRITLSNNQEVFVGVSHGTGTGPDESDRRITSVWLEEPEKRTVSAAAICRPPDNFCRATGRLIAARRLNAKLRDLKFSREDRRKIFQAIYS